MKHLLKCICLSLVFVLPLTTYAELIGEVVFLHPDNPNELWITDLTDTDNARLLYQQTHPIRDFSVQKNGNYIATLTKYSDPNKPVDIYLIDTDNINDPERMMTHQRFHKILDVHLSQKPDLIYTNFLPAITEQKNKHDKLGRRTSGIYLICNKEIVAPTVPPQPHIPQALENIIPPRDVLSPRVSLIKGVVTEHLELSPDSKYLAYDTPEGVYLINLETRQVLRVSIDGRLPTFSPDGTKLAVVYWRAGLLGFWYDLDVYDVPSLRHSNTIVNFNNHIEFKDMKWSPDGRYVVYTTYRGAFWENNTTYYHFAIPYTGGEPIRILDDMFENGVPKFDWTHVEEVFPVEPKNRLTTLWGKLKQ
ncbi:hypothetical protein C6501_13405 [Candidatus Poribacteria bacterium]|nr:MAG: hypothetical protein C6501_13405 [Candidatus Poribacteria bacterium]